MALAIVVLAAGRGSRMAADRPKALVPLAGRPMLLHVLEAARAAAPERLVVVAAPQGRDTIAAVAAPTAVVVQAHPRGTGDAVAAALPALAGFAGAVVVLYGDCPLIRPASLRRLAAAVPASPRPGVAVLTYRHDGTERDSGFIAADAAGLPGWLERLSPNAAGEIHWPDILAIAETVARLPCAVTELLGANTPADLQRLEELSRCGG